MRRRWTLGLSLLVVAGLACDWTVFDELEAEAGVWVFEAPDDYSRGRFGNVVTAYQGPTGGERVSRLAVSGGADSPLVVYDIWTGSGLGKGTSNFQACRRTTECDPGTGAALAGLSVWEPADTEHTLCVMATAPMAGGYHVNCEQPAVSERNATSFTGFGSSVAALPEGHPLGLAVVGAEREQVGRGALLTIDRGSAIQPFDLGSEDVVPAAAGIGSRLAISPLAGGELLVVASAQATSKVWVFTVAEDRTVTPRACMESSAGGYGLSLVAADLNGDDLPEIAIASDADAQDRQDHVQLYDGADLPAAPAEEGTCPAWPVAPRELRCRDARGVVCAGSGFGGALATGDVDGDGRGDLIVGASLATVDGASGAGAVFVFPGASIFDDLPKMDALTLSNPSSGDRLGRSVAAVPTNLGSGLTPRDEPVAGAPGANLVALFLCSGLPGDTPDIGTRCIPGR